MRDSAILDYWNGRPSIWLSANNGDPFLHWLVFGHVEAFDLWMHARLTWPIADAITENPPASFNDVLKMIPDGEVRFVVEDEGRPLVIVDWRVPHGNPTVADIAPRIAAQLLAGLTEHGSDAVALKMAAAEVEQLSA